MKAQVAPLAHCMPPVIGRWESARLITIDAITSPCVQRTEPGDEAELGHRPRRVGALSEAIVLVDTDAQRLREGRHGLRHRTYGLDRTSARRQRAS